MVCVGYVGYVGLLASACLASFSSALGSFALMSWPFSHLVPFCVWYVNYGSVLQVFLIYKDFVIILLFSRE